MFPSRLTDRLTAVNVLLASIGEAPVNDLEISESVDVANATRTLDEIDLTVQAEGWSWNEENNFALVRTVDGEVLLPERCLHVAKAYWPNGSLADKVTERGRKLYDMNRHTYRFDSTVIVDMVVHLAWEELPEAARRYITIRAAKQFQGRFQSSGTVDRITDDEVARARTVLEQKEDSVVRHNQVYDNVDAVSRLYGRGMRRR